jgi:hypothetical protein
MLSSGMLRHVAVIRTDDSEETMDSFLRIERIIERATTLELEFLRSVLRLLVTANFVHSSLILFSLMMEAIHFCRTSVLTRAKRRHIPENAILQSHRPENRKPYIALTGWAL